MIDSHPYVKIFIETMKILYSNSYDGNAYLKRQFNMNQFQYNVIGVSHRNNSLTLKKSFKKDEIELPSISIVNIDDLERVLRQYIFSIKNSDSFYNILDSESFFGMPNEDKIKIIFESTMLNASNSDLYNIENYFRRYTSFINDETFKELRRPTKLGEFLDDSLFVMSKRSELEYETPFYLAFMMSDSRVELPNIRLGIEESGDKKIAHIMAT